MKNLRTAAALSVLLFASPLAHPEDWTGAGADDNWSTGANWDTGVQPNAGPTTELTFTAASARFTPVVDLPWIVHRITVNSAGVYSFSGASLTFDGAAPFLSLNGAPHTVANPLIFNATTDIFPVGTLALAGGTGGAAGPRINGTVLLNGPSIHSGPTFVTAGATLRIGDGVTGPGQVFEIVNDGLVQLQPPPGGMSTEDAITGTGEMRVSGDVANIGGIPWQHAGRTTIDAGATFGGEIDNNARLILDGQLDTGNTTVGSLSGTGQLNTNGNVIIGGDNFDTAFLGGLGGAGNITKIGTGRLDLVVTTMHSGFTTVDGGTLAIGDGATGPGLIFDVVTNATIELHPPPGGMTTEATFSGTGNLVVAGNDVVQVGSDYAHTGTTTIRSAAYLAARIVNGGAMTLDGTFETGGSTVASMGGVGGTLLMNGLFTTGGDNIDTTLTAGMFGGAGDFRKIGTGTQTLLITTVHTGATIVDGGTLVIGDGTTSPGQVFALVVNGNLELRPAPGGMSTEQTVTGTGNILVAEGMVAQIGSDWSHAGTTTVDAGAQLDARIMNNALLTVNGLMNTGGSTVGSVAGAGTININGGDLVAGADGTSTTFSGVMASNGRLIKVGNGRLTLTGANTYTGGTEVLVGALAITGSMMGTVVVDQGATLFGTGTVNGPVIVNTNGTIAPGLSPGLLSVGNLTLAGVLAQEIEGTAIGTQYDNLAVTGTVTIAGGTLALSGAYVPVAGNVFIVIDNDGVDAVVGTFAGLPEGANVVLNGRTLQISYVGGTGNDVVLGAVAPAAPAAAPIPTLSQWALAALALLMLAAGALQARRRV